MILSLVLSGALCALALGPTDIHAQDPPTCLNPQGLRGECVGIRECAPLLQLLQSEPLLPQTRRFLVQSRCGTIGTDPKVCCVTKTVDEKPSSVPPPTDGNKDVGTRSDTNLEYDFSNNALLPSDCGADVLFYVIERNDTAFDEFPWIALLEYETPSGDKTLRCGGVLISNRYVLTAAHCVVSYRLAEKRLRLVSVRLGEFNLLSDRDCIDDSRKSFCANDHISVDIAEQFVHEDYNQYNPHRLNDIAVLRLDREVRQTAFIKPICLPRTPSAEKRLYVSGWGRNEYNYTSPVKLKLGLPAFDTQACANIYYWKERIRLGHGQFCAGGELQENFCSADSGGPLMAFERGNDGSGKWACVGILSMGPQDCGTQGYPGVYTRVIDFIPWIISKIKP